METPTLTDLAIKHGTDKYGITQSAPSTDATFKAGHFYAGHYDLHFAPFRHRPINVLEIGVGGYEDPTKGGESLRMWKEYFSKAQIHSLDYYDKTALQEERIRIYRGSQDDPALLQRMHEESGGGFDIIIDDGSHCNHHVIASFKILFPLLRKGGIYAIEDLQTSYWKHIFGGSSTELSSPMTSMGFLKSLIDCLNHVEFDLPGYEPSYYDKHIVSMHFYHNLAFIYKGDNDEVSNTAQNNTLPEAFINHPKPEWGS